MITLTRKRNKREYPVDGVFNVGRGAYQVREADGRYYSKFDSSGIPEYGCQSCCFRMNRNNGACAMLACRADERVDGREVIFEKNMKKGVVCNKTIITFTPEFEKEKWTDTEKDITRNTRNGRVARTDTDGGITVITTRRTPERLERGYTKGYVNGNVSEGKIGAQPKQRTWYDKMFNPTLTDLIEWKCDVEWHDDDWCEEYEP